MSENRKFVSNFTLLLAILVLASMALYLLVEALSKGGFGNIVRGTGAAPETVAATIMLE